MIDTSEVWVDGGFTRGAGIVTTVGEGLMVALVVVVVDSHLHFCVVWQSLGLLQQQQQLVVTVMVQQLQFCWQVVSEVPQQSAFIPWSTTGIIRNTTQQEICNKFIFDTKRVDTTTVC